MKPRDPVFVHHGKKWRPGFVLEVQEDGACLLVIAGTGTQRDHYPYVVFEARTNFGRAQKFTKDTYFYASGLALSGRRSAGVRPHADTALWQSF